jgi:pimeloyl-ACP methyl ester carboxylesterase
VNSPITRLVELPSGTVEYRDTGGGGPVVVLLHGLLMDESLWDEVVSALSSDHRCVVPTLPLGAHRRPMGPEADLSLRGVARLVGDLLERLELRDVTLVGNDTGGAITQLVMAAGNKRVARTVLVSCEAFDNVPPGLTGRTIVFLGKLPPTLFGMFMQQLRMKPARRLPVAFGWLTKRGDAFTRAWLRPILSDRAIRRDAVRVLRALGADRNVLLDVEEALRRYDRPALVVWATEDRVMPPEHGERLAVLLPRARLVEIEDSYALIPLDQPDRLAVNIREFAGQGTDHRATRP